MKGNSGKGSCFPSALIGVGVGVPQDLVSVVVFVKKIMFAYCLWFLIKSFWQGMTTFK